jgi:hypothetical protein
MRRTWSVVIAAALAALSPLVHAAPPKPAPTKPAATPKTLADRLTGEARKHFDTAVDLYGVKDYAGAMAEFRQAYELAREPRVLRNVAVCLKSLARYSEAIEALRLELKDATDLTADEKTKLEEEVDILLPLTSVATIDVNEPGAEVSVDGRVLGVTPLATDARVDVGERTFTAKKEGFRDASVKLVVAGATKPKVTLKLEKIVATVAAATGTLKVVEAKGLVVDVVVDGAVVGKTPWEGTLPPGSHTVSLSGPDETGTALRSVPIVAGDAQTLQLESKPLDAALEVTVDPDTARVLADGAEISQGSFKGKLPRGKHVVEIIADGYRPERRELVLTTTHPTLASVTLTRIRHIYVEVSPAFGVVMAPGFKVVSPTGATEPDLTTPSVFGALVQVGYRFSWNLGIEALIGSTFMGNASQADHVETVSGTTTAGPPVSLTSPSYALQYQLHATLVGVGLSYHVFETLPITIGLATGLAIGGAVFNPGFFPEGTRSTNFGDQSSSFVKPFFAPTFRLGVRAGEGFALHFGATLLMIPMTGFDGPSQLKPKDGSHTDATFSLPFVSGSGTQMTALSTITLEFDP